MKKRLMYIVLGFVLLFAGCSSPATSEEATSEPIQIAVSIVPQATIAKAVGGEFVDVVTMIPPGNSPANYAPTQQEMTKLSESMVYFGIGVPTEDVNIMPLLESGDFDVPVVHLNERIDAVYPARFFGEAEHDHGEEGHEEHEDHDHEEHADEDHDHEEHADEDHDHEEHADEDGHDHGHGARDPHIWLSPKRIKLMAEEMAAELIKLDPDHEGDYTKNLEGFLAELGQVTSELETLLGDMEGESFLIYHPSLGYFADEYGLEMVALESEGKAATVQGMAKVIDFAKDHHIKTVFYQAEFDSKQAQLLAGEIGGKAVQMNPLSPEIVSNLKEMGTLIKNSIE